MERLLQALSSFTEAELGELLGDFRNALVRILQVEGDRITVEVLDPQSPVARFCNDLLSLLRQEQERRAGRLNYPWRFPELAGYADDELLWFFGGLCRYQKDLLTPGKDHVLGFVSALRWIVKREAEGRGLAERATELELKHLGAHSEMRWQGER